MRRTFLGTALAVTSLYLLVPIFAFEISSSPALDAHNKANSYEPTFGKFTETPRKKPNPPHLELI
jgi:hypothetical protein